MTTLKDMPMISVEQKNRFREAALEVEAERDEAKRMLASACEYLSRVSVSVGGEDDEDPQTAVELVEGLVAENLQLSELLKAAGIDSKEIKAENAALKSKLEYSELCGKQTFEQVGELARRDARVKAEALESMARNTPMKYSGPTWQELKLEAQKYRKQAEEMGDE